ncbi:MAG TPA: NUDIX domain-containing protein, partial [Kofleriaceae bacterium]|nr:NUDIX domain-containing protein [Kofleriaceae bacterium]
HTRVTDERGCELAKVTAFVTCEREGRPHLLLFEHPLAGVQLPAGSIEDGEEPIAAALREVAEETGVSGLRDATELASARTELAPGSAVLLARLVPRTEPHPDALSCGAGLSRGLTVEVLDRWTDFARIRYDELDRRRVPPMLVARTVGWVQAHLLGGVVVRHYVHLRHDGSGPARWTQDADGHRFAPFWAPLVPRPAICEAQEAWLDAVYEQLLL